MRKISYLLLFILFSYKIFAQGVGELFVESEKLIKKGDYTAAIKKLNQCAVISPNMAAIYYKRGMAYSLDRQNLHALNDFNKAINLNPDLEHYYRWRGWTNYQLGKYREALRDYEIGLSKNPPNPEDYYNELGLVFHLQKKYNKAIESYNKAIALFPKSQIYLGNRGEAKYRAGDLNGAYEDYKKIFEIDPNFRNARIFNFMGLIKKDLSAFKEAMQYFEKAIDVSDLGVYHFNKGVTLIDFKSPEEACICFQKAIQKNYLQEVPYIKKYCKKVKYNKTNSDNYYVNDYMGLFGSTGDNKLNTKLKQYDDSTTKVINVVVIEQTYQRKLRRYVDYLLSKKGLEEKGDNKGVLLLLIKSLDKVIFRVSDELKGQLSTETCQKIYQLIMKPHFEKKKYYKGMDEGVKVITSILEGKMLPEDIKNPKSFSWMSFFLVAIFFLILLLLFGTKHLVQGSIIILASFITFILAYGFMAIFALPIVIIYIFILIGNYNTPEKA